MKREGVVKKPSEPIRPLPWKSALDKKDYSLISDDNDFPVGLLYDADAAEYMLRAVNERKRLRELLRQSRQYITGHVCIVNGSSVSREIQTREAQRMVELIDAALNGEKGEGG